LEVSPGELSSLFEKYFLVVTIIAWLTYLVSKFFEKRLSSRRDYIKARFLQKIATFCATMAATFSFIFFFRYEAIPVLGGRFWVMIWGVVGIIWLGYLIKYYVVNITQQKMELEEKQRKDKYLVGVKKKKKRK